VWLLLGLFLNESNWLRKILVRSANAITPTADGPANIALTLMLATIAAAKAHEGWNRICSGVLANTLASLPADEELEQTRIKASALLGKGCIAHVIRRGIAFHYPTSIDLGRLDKLDDIESYILSERGGNGALVLSHLATMALFDELIGVSPGQVWQERIRATFNDIVAAVAAYSDHVAILHGHAIVAWLAPEARPIEVFTLDAPLLIPDPPVFFAHPPI
jgi:hypothetical protein